MRIRVTLCLLFSGITQREGPINASHPLRASESHSPQNTTRQMQIVFVLISLLRVLHAVVRVLSFLGRAIFVFAFIELEGRQVLLGSQRDVQTVLLLLGLPLGGVVEARFHPEVLLSEVGHVDLDVVLHHAVLELQVPVAVELDLQFIQKRRPSRVAP